MMLIIVLLPSPLREGGLTRLIVKTPTYDGSGQALHPDVIRMERGLGGYSCWMVLTPYPNRDASYENPSLLASPDCGDWLEPEGLRNPLVAPPLEGHYSDPDIFLAKGKLWIYFRWSQGLEERIYAISSDDGISWSEKVEVLGTRSESLLSPSVVVEEGSLRMWYIDIRPSPNVIKLRTSASPEGPYSGPTVCHVDGVPNDMELWHLDVIKVRDGYDAFIVLINRGKGLRKSFLYFATSKDGVNWRLSSEPILRPSINGWDDLLIYRSTALLLEESEGWGKILRRYAVWYSACNKAGEWHIGYAELSICIGDEIRLCGP